MNVLYEDSAVIICEKPAGVLSENDGSGSDIGSMASIAAECECVAVHRLDRGTGGAIVLAKSPAAAAEMSKLIQARNMNKEYLAVIRGEPEDREGVMRDLLYRDAGKNKSYVVTRRRRGVKEASLEYRCLETVHVGTGKKLSLVWVRLHTGRTHQIRAQFASRGMPLVGDGKYGSRDNAPNPALWSARISFVNSESGKEISVVSMPERKYPWSLFSESSLKSFI